MKLEEISGNTNNTDVFLDMNEKIEKNLIRYREN